MRPLHRVLFGLLILIALIAGFSLGHILHPTEEPTELVLAPAAPKPPADMTHLLDQPRPGFSLPDLQNRTRDLSEWDGKTLLINFWATWCAPCREEIPLFQRLRDEYGADRFEVIGVALDLPDLVAEFQAEYDVTYPMLYGQSKASDIMKQYGNQAGTLPYSILVDGSGIIRKIHDRRLHEPQLRDWLTELLIQNNK